MAELLDKVKQAFLAMFKDQLTSLTLNPEAAWLEHAAYIDTFHTKFRHILHRIEDRHHPFPGSAQQRSSTNSASMQRAQDPVQVHDSQLQVAPKNGKERMCMAEGGQGVYHDHHCFMYYLNDRCFAHGTCCRYAPTEGKKGETWSWGYTTHSPDKRYGFLHLLNYLQVIMTLHIRRRCDVVVMTLGST